MLLVRPVRTQDHDEVLALAQLAGIGMTSLPPDSYVLQQKIERAVNSFAGRPGHEGGEAFLFVLEDTDEKQIVGTTGLVAHVGLKRPFYSYKISTIVQTSDKLEIYSKQRVLHMVNDYTGCSEIGSLFLMPEYRRDGIGKFLSRSRYLMLAELPHLFSDIVISEIRGVQDAKGESPFYNHLAKYFFQMEFKRSDFIYATQGGQFIADLMPKYPIYVKLLHPDAVAAMGQPLSASMPAKKMLEKEGFAYEGYIDVFDAGPTLQCEREHIRTVSESRNVPVVGIEDKIDGERHLMSNTSQENFSMCRAPLAKTFEGAVICRNVAEHLQLEVGDNIRYVL